MTDSLPIWNVRKLAAAGLTALLIGLGALLALTLTNSVGAEEHVERTAKEPLTTLTFEGAASRSVELDGTVARFSISALDESVGDAVSAGNSALVDVKTALQMGCNDDNPDQLCVPADQLRTVSIWINEEYEWTEQGRVSLGFRYDNSLLARIDGVDQAGLLIDTILSAGGDNVRFDGIDFTASGRAEAERLALLDAIDDAQASADAIAGHMGYEIVRVVELNTVGNLTASRSNLASADSAMADESFEPTPVFGGSESVTSRVRMVFELRPLAESGEAASETTGG
jgi:hypothetical protein